MVSQWNSSWISSQDSVRSSSVKNFNSYCWNWMKHQRILKEGSSSCQCSMTSHGDQKTTRENASQMLKSFVGNLSTSKETVLFLGFFVPPDWFSLCNGNYGWFCSMLKQSSHQVLQNSALKYTVLMTKILNHPLNQPSPLLWSNASLPQEFVNWCLAFTHQMWWCVFWYIRTPWIQLLRTRCWRRRCWICKNVSRYTMQVPNNWRPVFAGRHSQRTA